MFRDKFEIYINIFDDIIIVKSKSMSGWMVRNVVPSNVIRSDVPFKQKYSFEQRKQVADSLLARHLNRVPVIVSPANGSTPDIDRHKFLVPRDCAVYQFTAEVRNHIKISQQDALFFYFNNTVAAHSMMLGTMYDKYKDPDGFLYIVYSLENTFG